MSRPQRAKGLNADLENFELTDVMQLITQQVKCGILSVEGNDGKCSWSFNEGFLVDFNCQFSGHALNLRNILAKTYRIDEQQLLFLAEKGLSSDSDLEKELVKNKIIGREELAKTNLRRLIESFIITLQWTKGSYKFIPTSEVKNHAFLPPQDTNFIILEALRQIDEMAVMKKRLLPLERVFESTLAFSSDESSLEDDSLFQEGLEDQFDQDELGVYKLIDGKYSLAEVLNISTIGQFHTCRILLDFFERGIITPTIGDQNNAAGIKESKHYKHLTGIALLLLSCSVIISIFVSGWFYDNPKKMKNPTFFAAIIDNLKAEQEMAREQARKLLR